LQRQLFHSCAVAQEINHLAAVAAKRSFTFAVANVQPAPAANAAVAVCGASKGGSFQF
tara:strand:- start:94 stop:267 length:174 start_codon:yes stop_codon:yes gene_type:complete